MVPSAIPRNRPMRQAGASRSGGRSWSRALAAQQYKRPVTVSQSRRLDGSRGQVYQCGDQRGQARSSPARTRVRQPVHAEIITSPRQARHALAYVMQNWRNHQEDHVAPMSTWTIDWFSTAVMFPGWTEYGEQAFLWRGPATYDPSSCTSRENMAIARGVENGRFDLVPRGFRRPSGNRFEAKRPRRRRVGVVGG